MDAESAERAERHERRIRRYTHRCVHWNGLIHPGGEPPCKAGLDPQALFDSARERNGILKRAREWPCNQPSGAACPQHSALTREHAEREVADDEGSMNRMFKALAAAQAHFKGKPAGGAVIDCPNCSGRLHVSKAAGNGHLWGRCETKGCASWMQ